jgi:predicted DNA-binding protein YlxM (UPF0122 family)
MMSEKNEKQPPESKRVRKKAVRKKADDGGSRQTNADLLLRVNDLDGALSISRNKVSQLGTYVDQLRYTVSELLQREKELNLLSSLNERRALLAQRMYETYREQEDIGRQLQSVQVDIQRRRPMTVDPEVLMMDPRQKPDYSTKPLQPPRP